MYDYISENLQKISDGSLKIDDFTKQISSKMQKEYGVTITDDQRTELNKVFNNYRMGMLDGNGVLKKIDNIVKIPSSTPSNSSSSTGSAKKSSSPTTNTNNSTPVKEDTVDIVTEEVIETANQYDKVASAVASADVSVPGPAAPYSAPITAAVEEGKAAMESDVDNMKSVLGDQLESVSGTDESIPNFDIKSMSFSDISKLAYDVRKNSTPVEATEEFFRNNPNCRIEGNFAILTVNNTECKYDMKKHKFYIGGKVALDAKIYVPSGATNYSELNTYTYFVNKLVPNHIEKQTTNSILIQLFRSDNEWGNKSIAQTKMYQTGMVTQFVNAVAGTKLKEGCKNAIGGESVYGSHSLKTAANNYGLYQTVYCINNAAIVTGYNNYYGEKTQITADEMTLLNQMAKEKGLDVYFLNVAGDPNLNHGQTHPKWSDKKGNYAESYTYTGVVYMLENCPNINVHVSYPKLAPAPHLSENEMGLYEKLAENPDYASHYEYIPDEWTDFANGYYQNHEGYESYGIPAEVAKSKSVNANPFNTSK